MVQFLVDHASEGPLTVCDTEFGAGHAAAIFLGFLPHFELFMFDKFDRPYQLPALELVQKYFYQHVTQHFTDNFCLSVPRRLGSGGTQCYVLHGFSLCKCDHIDLMGCSPCGVLLAATAVNSLGDHVVYFGPRSC